MIRRGRPAEQAEPKAANGQRRTGNRPAVRRWTFTAWGRRFAAPRRMTRAFLC